MCRAVAATLTTMAQGGLAKLEQHRARGVLEG
jgi:hypothetical protein